MAGSILRPSASPPRLGRRAALAAVTLVAALEIVECQESVVIWLGVGGNSGGAHPALR